MPNSKKVYVIKHTWTTYEGDDGGIDGAYLSLKSAKKALKEWFDSVKEENYCEDEVRGEIDEDGMVGYLEGVSSSTFDRDDVWDRFEILELELKA